MDPSCSDISDSGDSDYDYAPANMKKWKMRSCKDPKSKTAKWLTKKGVSIDQINTRRLDGETPLTGACKNLDNKMLRALVNCGADVNVESKDGATPLILACDRDNYVAARILLKHGADGNRACTGDKCYSLNSKKCLRAFTPLMVACRNGNTDTVRLLLQHGAKANLQPDWRWAPRTPLLLVITSCSDEAMDNVAALIQHGADVDGDCKYDGCTPLFLAAQGTGRKDLELVTFLIAKGARVNKVCHDGSTPLHLTTTGQTAKVLLEHGADIEKQDREGATPLIKSCLRGFTETTLVLLERGANANAQDGAGLTPLLASTRHQGNAAGNKVMSRLLAKGAITSTADNSGIVPLIAVVSEDYYGENQEDKINALLRHARLCGLMPNYN